MKKEIKVLGETIDSENFPILYERAMANLEWTEKQVKSVAEKWHNGNVMSAMQALESDLSHG